MRFGLGLDGQYCDQYNPAVREFVTKRGSSHLSIVSPHLTYYEELIPASGKVVHHLSGIAPVDPVGPNLVRLSELNEYSRLLNAVWCCEDLGVWSFGNMALPYFVQPPLTMEVCEHTIAGILAVQANTVTPFVIENPYFSVVCGGMPLSEFFQRIVDRSGSKIVLDLPHLFSYCLATGRDPHSELKAFPLDAVVEFHIAGGKISKIHPNRYIDTHSDPILNESFQLLELAVPLCKNLAAVTYEIGRDLDEDIFTADVGRIEKILSEAEFQPFSHAVPS